VPGRGPARAAKSGAATPARHAPKPDVAHLVRLLADVTGHVAAESAALVPSAAGSLLGHALRELESSEPLVHAERLEELGYLANVLIAGEPNAGRRFRPIEALETAVAVCDEALASELGPARGTNDDRLRAATELLRARHLDQLFRRGWYARFAAVTSRKARA
jgi:hypothetical protein